MDKKEKGQALVEFSLVIVFFILLAAVFVDTAPLVGDFYIAKQMSARGARAASVYLADGERTCLGDVINEVGDPWLMNATWTMSVEGPCDANPNTTFPTGTEITVRIAVVYTPLFTGGFGWPPKEYADTWTFEVSTTDHTR